MTLPTLFHNISERQNAVKVAVFNSKFITALNSACAAGDIYDGYSSTYDFLKNGLSKHLKMSPICDSQHLRDCFGYDRIIYKNKLGKEKTIEVSKLNKKSSINILDKTFFNDTAAFVMADGTPVILTYRKKCIEDSSSVNSSISPCVAGLFDLNGSRSPNMFINKITFKNKNKITSEIGDLRSFNGAAIGCAGEIGEMCVVGSAMSSTSSNIEQMLISLREDNPEYEEKGIWGWKNSRDDWQIASDYCTEILGGHIPSANELAQIATALYGVDIEAGKNTRTGSMKNKEAVYAALGLNTSVNEFQIWSSETSSQHYAHYQNFLSNGSLYGLAQRAVFDGVANRYMVCLSD